MEKKGFFPRKITGDIKVSTCAPFLCVNIYFKGKMKQLKWFILQHEELKFNI